MTAIEVVKATLETTDRQVRQTFDDLTEEQYDSKLCDSALTPRQTLEHLCECYSNVVTYADGIEPIWGSFSIEDKSSENLWKEYSALRAAAVEKALTLDGPKLNEIAFGFIALHDTYHVGQVCQLRIHLDPNWNAYSIYE